jgi:hypothetical protein
MLVSLEIIQRTGPSRRECESHSKLILDVSLGARVETGLICVVEVTPRLWALMASNGCDRLARFRFCEGLRRSCIIWTPTIQAMFATSMSSKYGLEYSCPRLRYEVDRSFCRQQYVASSSRSGTRDDCWLLIYPQSRHQSQNPYPELARSGANPASFGSIRWRL